MSIGETAANGVNHTPSGTDSGEERISEVLANANSSDTREGFIAMSFCDFIAARLGSRNWVVARRTARITRKYGDDVVALSQQRYSTLHREFEASVPA